MFVRKLLMVQNIVLSICRIVAAVIMLQTLFFKFTGAEESVYIFSTVGLEPWGRYLVGALELVAALLILVPATSWLGAALALGLMAGAIGMHLTLLGISVKNDGGYLFFLALAVAICSAVVLFLERERWLRFLPRRHSGVI
jgi:putative oxidoreductase